MEQRKSNMELLRIMGIVMIAVFHCAYKSGFDFPPGFSVNKLAVKCFWMLGELGVNLFMLISGYFMVNGRFKWKKLIRLLAEAQFYWWLTLLIGSRVGACTPPQGIRGLFLAFFPVTLNRCGWFLTVYVLIYLLSPYLNLLIRAMDEKTYGKFLLTVLGLFCVIPTFFGFFFNATETMLYYNRFIWLIIMYFLGAYIYIYICKTTKIRTFLPKLTAFACRRLPPPSWCSPSWQSTGSAAFLSGWAQRSPRISGRPTRFPCCA